jgi:dihydroorotase
VLIRDGVITQIGTLEAGTQTIDQTIKADGLIALTGLVDIHTHLREPGREDAETVACGSAAAAIGGFTAILTMANTTPVTDTAEAAERVLASGGWPVWSTCSLSVRSPRDSTAKSLPSSP